MAWPEDLFKVNPFTGIALGLGASLLAPVAGQVLGPAAKAAIKDGLIAYQGVAELGAGASEIIAEAHAERAAQSSPAETRNRPSGGGSMVEVAESKLFRQPAVSRARRNRRPA